jgi:hypothetical protein
MSLVHETTGAPESRPCRYRLPLPGLRVGSRFTTRHGVIFEVREAIVFAAPNGSESPSVVVERTRDGRVTELLMTVGVLANMTRGARHRRGSGALIDWSQVARRRCGDFQRSGLAPRFNGRSGRKD